jgi:6,7-dimethyl-8-ribityllumazine synthase
MSLASPSVPSVAGAVYAFGIVAARFNEHLVDALLERVIAGLRAAGVKRKKITVVRVPGSHELPWTVHLLARRARLDGVIALGVLIGGDTSHHEMVGQSVSLSLQRVAIDTRTPVINGVIVANTRAQAAERSTGKINRGAEFAAAALEMANVKRKLSR